MLPKDKENFVKKLINLSRRIEKMYDSKKQNVDENNSKLAKKKLNDFATKYGLKSLIKLYDSNINFKSVEEMEVLLMKINKNNEQKKLKKI